MTRALLFIISVHLLACGGSKPGAAKPRGRRRWRRRGRDRRHRDGRRRGRADKPAARRATPGEFAINEADAASRPTNGKLKATDTEAAVRFFVIDKDKGPITGIVIALTAPTGEKYYAAETDAAGFTEVLLPIGKKYDLVFLSLGRRDIAAQVAVPSRRALNPRLRCATSART